MLVAMFFRSAWLGVHALLDDVRDTQAMSEACRRLSMERCDREVYR